ncbi:MAG TPA: glycan-binding surface protein [Puia sp.]|nr:glycan-binding surface protein [Puia sp.]
MLPYRISTYCFLLLAAGALLTQYACKKENNGNPPKIDRIRAISPAPDDSVLTAAAPGQIVVLQGSHFTNTQEILFDGFPASINTALFSDENMVVTVPTIAWDSIPDGKLNTVEVITASGKTSYTFTITAPVPVAYSASNENALAGETVTLKGANFYGITGITLPGGVSVSDFKVSTDSKTIVFTMPANNLTTGDSIRITGQYGTGTSMFVFDNYLAETPGYLADFECCGTYFGWQWWGGIQSSDGGLFPGNTGSYIEVHPVSTPINPGDGSWYADNRAVMVAASPWVADVNAAVSDYALKFEMSTKVAWTAGALIIRNTNWDYIARYAPWEKSSSGSFSTSGWTTVTIPLTQFLSTSNSTYNASGSPAVNFTTLMGGSSSECDLMLYNDGKGPIDEFDAAFDNVRIVKVK